MFKKEQQTETIEVRNDERFDQQKLVNFLVGQLPGADNDLKIKQFGGGKANLTYLLNYGSHEYVLRRPPLGPVAKGAHDMGREYKVFVKTISEIPLRPPRVSLFRQPRHYRCAILCHGTPTGNRCAANISGAIPGSLRCRLKNELCIG